MLRPKQINLQVNKKLRLENQSDQNRQSNNEVPRFFNLGLINRNSKTIRALVEHNPVELTLVKSTRKDTILDTKKVLFAKAVLMRVFIFNNC